MTDTAALPRLVPPWEVERELIRQTKVLQGPDERPMQRARMANLVIYCNSQERAARLNTEIPEVVAVHPARVLLLIADPESSSTELTTTVLVRRCAPLNPPPERGGLREGHSAFRSRSRWRRVPVPYTTSRLR